MSAKITTKRALFVQLLLADPKLNGTRAAEQAGFRHPKQEAHRLLSDPAIRAEVDAAIADRALRVKERSEATAVAIEAKQDEVLNQLDRLVASDLRRLAVDGDESPLAQFLRSIPDDLAPAISSIDVQFSPATTKQTDDGVVVAVPPQLASLKLRLWDKPAAVRLKMQHLGLLREQESAPQSVTVIINKGGQAVVAVGGPDAC